MLNYDEKIQIFEISQKEVLDKPYAISSKTLALMPLKKENRVYTIVIEDNRQFIVKKRPLRVVIDSLITYGKTYEEVVRFSQRHLTIQQKFPICVKLAQDIIPMNIFFPTESPHVPTNVWLSLDGIEGFDAKGNGEMIIHLRNKQSIVLNLSTNILYRQISQSHFLKKKATELFSYNFIEEPSEESKKQTIVWLIEQALGNKEAEKEKIE